MEYTPASAEGGVGLVKFDRDGLLERYESYSSISLCLKPGLCAGVSGFNFRANG